MSNLMHFEIVSMGLALQHIKAGSIKPLAVLTHARIADLPDVPTIAEAGYAGAAYVPWYGIYVTAGTPDALAEKINNAINNALQNPDVQRQLSVSDIPGKPMSLGGTCDADEGRPREADVGVKTAGMSLHNSASGPAIRDDGPLSDPASGRALAAPIT